MIFLAGISVAFALVSVFFVRPFPVFSVLLCIPIAVASIVVLSWLVEDTDIPARHEVDQDPKDAFDRSFRLSKIKDPSQKGDPNWWKQEKVDPIPEKQDPAFRFSNLKDAASEEKKEDRAG